MPSIILSHPFSGALYKYFSDQLRDYPIKGRINHPYYRTLWGDDYARHLELALSFLVLYDDVWIAPADNHFPTGRLDPEDRSHIIELGLHADWDDFTPFNSSARRDHVADLCAHPLVQNLLGGSFKIPRDNWDQLITYALYESSLSARKRIPILCSPGRRSLISTLVQIQRPSLHPLFTAESEVTFVDSYRSLSGMALAPRSLEHLMDAKPDKSVRTYGRTFLAAATAPQEVGGVNDVVVAKATLEAIETESVSELFAGVLNWAASFLRLIHQPVLAATASGGSYLASSGAEDAGWYEFKGSVDRAIDKAEFVRRLERVVREGQGSSL